MPGRNEAIYKRALMRDLMRRVQRIGAQCGGNGQEMLPDNGGGGDEFSNVAHRVTVAMEGIKRDARAKCRVAHAQSQHEAIALVHEIRKKKVGLKEDLKRLQALNAELETQISKKREKSNGKQKKEAEIKQMEDLLRQRVATFGELSETAARVEALADKVTTQTTAKEDQALAAANAHRPRHQRLKLMDTTRNKDGTFERPKAEPEPEMDAETAALFEEVEFKQKQIEDAVDGITKQVGRLKEQAVVMGQELTTQGVILDHMEERMDDLNAEVAGLTLRVGKFRKEVRPSNFFLGLCGLVLLLGLATLIVYQVAPAVLPR